MFLLFILQLFFLIWRMCFLFVYYVSRLFSIYFFFSFLCRSLGFPSHPKTRGKKTTTKNPKSRPKSVETCLPNKCVCPPVCPTASKAQTFEPPLTIHFDVLFAQFFLVIKAAVLHMEFCFMTGLPQESRRFFVFAHSPAQWAKCQAGNHPKSVQSLAHKRFVPQKSGTKRNGWEKFCESFVYVYNCGVGCTCHERNMKKKPKYRTAESYTWHT